MRYKGFLLATASGVAFAPAAGAADLPAKSPAFMPPPPVSWEGWYVGLHAGANWQQSNVDPYIGSATGTGFIGGGQLGYNWQRGNAVYGFEGDFSGLTGKAKYPGEFGYDVGSSQIKWLSTIRGRMGLAVNDTMVYATGGLAFGKVENSINLLNVNTKSSSKTRVGWTIGGGVEHMWDRHWTIGLEALFVDLGHSDVNVSPFKSAFRVSNQSVIGRMKLNYKW